MLNNSWAPTATLLCTCILAGCTGAGRFSRQEYAQLDPDPFLAAEADMESAEATAEELIASGRDKVEETADRFAFVNQNSVADEMTADDFASPTAPEITRPPVSAEVPVAAPFNDFDQVLAQSQPAQAVGKSSDDFSAWLDELDKKSNEVVQTSAEFGERMNQSATAVRQTVQQEDFSTFPGTPPKIDVQPAAAFKEQVKDNFFDDSDFVFGAPAESTAKASAQPEEDASWPPVNFERL
jgi:hypothetical protein